jgi:predicted DNA-binding WGR domain protein
MAADVTYLELSEANAHKFYEVTLDGTKVTIRYGRIGDPGQSSSSTYPTEDKARAEAGKKVQEKLKKGYARATPGGRAKRAVTSRSAMVAQTAAAGRKGGAAAKGVPLLWRFESGASALGIYIDRELCWVGNQAGDVLALGHDGRVHQRYKLPDGVKCLVADGAFRYAGCDDGKVYDLSGKVPRVAYEIADGVDIYWLDVFDGVLAVSDALGNVVVVNHEDESQWAKKSRGDKGWMVRCDELGVYHGHSGGVTMYDWEDGAELWTRPTDGWIGFGWQEESTVFASTANGKVHRFSKKGDVQQVYVCDAFLCSCATAEGGKYVFAGGTHGDLYCFAADGTRLWKLSSGCGTAQSMQYLDGKLYFVTHLGFLGCADVSEAAIAAAERGVVPDAISIGAPAAAPAPVPAAAAALESARASDGVVVECFRDGGKLRMRVVSEGYRSDWNCQFPKDVREEGARYVVDRVIASSRGGFYRAIGDVRRLAEGG